MTQRNPASAEPYLRRALDVRQSGLPAGHPDVAKAQLSLGSCLVELGKDAEAETLLRQARATLAAQLGAGDETVKEADAKLAVLQERAPAR